MACAGEWSSRGKTISITDKGGHLQLDMGPGTPALHLAAPEEESWPMKWAALRSGEGDSKDPLYFVELSSATSPTLAVRKATGDSVVEFTRAEPNGKDERRPRSRSGRTASRSRSPAKGAVDGFRPGDWLCSKCAHHNFAKNKSCRNCSADKPGAAEQPTVDPKGNRESLVNQVKRGQRESKPFKERWWAYCDRFGNGFYDPVRHETRLLEDFLEQELKFQNGEISVSRSGSRKPPGRKTDGSASGSRSRSRSKSRRRKRGRKRRGGGGGDRHRRRRHRSRKHEKRKRRRKRSRSKRSRSRSRSRHSKKSDSESGSGSSDEGESGKDMAKKSASRKASPQKEPEKTANKSGNSGKQVRKKRRQSSKPNLALTAAESAAEEAERALEKARKAEGLSGDPMHEEKARLEAEAEREVAKVKNEAEAELRRQLREVEDKLIEEKACRMREAEGKLDKAIAGRLEDAEVKLRKAAEARVAEARRTAEESVHQAIIDAEKDARRASADQVAEAEKRLKDSKTRLGALKQSAKGSGSEARAAAKADSGEEEESGSEQSGSGSESE